MKHLPGTFLVRSFHDGILHWCDGCPECPRMWHEDDECCPSVYKVGSPSDVVIEQQRLAEEEYHAQREWSKFRANTCSDVSLQALRSCTRFGTVKLAIPIVGRTFIVDAAIVQDEEHNTSIDGEQTAMVELQYYEPAHLTSGGMKWKLVYFWDPEHCKEVWMKEDKLRTIRILSSDTAISVVYRPYHKLAILKRGGTNTPVYPCLPIDSLPFLPWNINNPSFRSSEEEASNCTLPRGTDDPMKSMHYRKDGEWHEVTYLHNGIAPDARIGITCEASPGSEFSTMEASGYPIIPSVTFLVHDMECVVFGSRLRGWLKNIFQKYAFSDENECFQNTFSLSGNPQRRLRLSVPGNREMDPAHRLSDYTPDPEYFLLVHYALDT